MLGNQSTELAAFLKLAEEYLQEQAASKNLEYNFDFAEELPTLNKRFRWEPLCAFEVPKSKRRSRKPALI
jgi:hypothetical protein